MRLSPMQHRSALLDCIRALAIILVVFFHVATRYDPVSLDAVAQFFLRYGSKGVDIFFPLSGFLITRFLLLKHDTTAIRTFFLRRLFRIVPLYMTAVTLFAIGLLVTGWDLYLLERIWINYTFLTGWYVAAWGEAAVPYTITWSLSVEEFAYVAFGLLAWLSRRQFPILLILSCILPALLRLYLLAETDINIYFLPLARLDSIAIGGVAAWLFGRGAPLLVLIPPLFAVILGLALLDTLLWQTLIYTLISLATCFCIVLVQSKLKDVTGSVIAVFANIGFYSYFTYLFHLFAIEAVLLAMSTLEVIPPFWPTALLCLGLTHGAAVLSYRYFEGPLMRYGRSFERPSPRVGTWSGNE